MSLISHRIKGIRKIAGFTQLQFGKEIGVTKTHISKIESGNANPSDHLLKLICERFDINEEWLRTGEGEMQRGESLNLRQILDEGIQDNKPNIGYFVGMMKAAEQSVLGNVKILKEASDDFFKMFTAVKASDHIRDEDKGILLKILHNLRKNFLRCSLSVIGIECSLAGKEKKVQELHSQLQEDYMNVILEMGIPQTVRESRKEGKAELVIQSFRLTYDDYYADVEFDTETGLYQGKEREFEHITFKGETLKEIEMNFHKAVDDFKNEYITAGKEIPKHKRKVFSVGLGPGVYEFKRNVPQPDKESEENDD